MQALCTAPQADEIEAGRSMTTLAYAIAVIVTTYCQARGSEWEVEW